MNQSTPEVTPEAPATQEKVDQSAQVQDQSTNVQEGGISPENEVNWKKFREVREQERKEKVEAVRRAQEKEAEASALKAAMEAILNKQPTNSSQSSAYQYEEEETEDQRIEKKVNHLLEINERKRREEQQRIEAQTLPQRLERELPGFNQICSTENLDYLEYHHGKISQAYKHMPDTFEKWEAIYDTVKKLVPNTNPNQIQARVDRNMAKPQSMSSPQTSQGHNSAPANRLDEARKTANWERMQRTLKGIA